jgi:hypothetical protein
VFVVVVVDNTSMTIELIDYNDNELREIGLLGCGFEKKIFSYGSELVPESFLDSSGTMSIFIENLYLGNEIIPVTKRFVWPYDYEFKRSERLAVV